MAIHEAGLRASRLDMLRAWVKDRDSIDPYYRTGAVVEEIIDQAERLTRIEERLDILARAVNRLGDFNGAQARVSTVKEAG